MFCQSLSIRYVLTLVLLLFSCSACTHIPIRVDESGAPQREYTYQLPLKIDDGWQVSSLAEEGVREEIIDDMMKLFLLANIPIYSVSFSLKMVTSSSKNTCITIIAIISRISDQREKALLPC